MRKISGSPKEIKEVNKSLIMTSLKERKSATRLEISDDIGVSQTTVRSILSELLEDEEIIIDGQQPSTGGRRAERYSINKNKKLSLIMYFSREGLNYHVLDFLGDKIIQGVVYNQKQANIEIVKEILDKVLESYKEVLGVVISVPGVISEDGYYSGYGIDDWIEHPIGKFIRENYKIPVVVQNDLNIISLGYSIDNNIRDIVYISLTSLGAGAGIIVNKKIIDGSTNFAGEVGCLPYKNSVVNEILLKNDKEYINIASYLIATVNCILNPQIIVLGGELFNINHKDEVLSDLERAGKYNTLCNIEFEDNEEKYAIIGLTNMALDLIDQKVLIIRE